MRISRTIAAAAVLALAACEQDPSSPEEATADLVAVTGTQITGRVGTFATPAPTVKAVDEDGDPVQGLTVTFTVTGGGELARTTATTDVLGIATPGTWKLGTVAGEQTVVATAAGRSLTFRATAGPDNLAALTPVAGMTNTALTGALVPTAPAVRATDQYGNPTPNEPVVFTVMSGGGSVTGGVQMTDANGIATVGGWRLGVEPGPQTLRASQVNVATTFTATATLPIGCAVAAYAAGATVEGTWSTGDCASPGGRGANDPTGALYDQYELTLTEQRTIDFELAAAGARSIRIRRKATAGDYVMLALGPSFTTTRGDTLVHRAILAPDTYIVEVQSAAAGATGSYTFRSAVRTNTDIVCRPVVQATLGVTIQSALDPATDCESPVVPGTYEDWVVLPLKTGDRVRLTLTTTTMPPGLVFRDDRLGPASPTLASRSSTTPGTVTLEWTATFDTYHEIVVYKNGGPTAPYGAYTLKVERF